MFTQHDEMRRVLGMVLAGGEGRRLLALTHRRAKPVVLFGGKYRVMDFVLSNLVNSGLSDIGILTQYEPDSIHKHMAFAWHIDRDFARIDILTPHRRSDTYTSTTDALYKRLDYILGKSPDKVLVVPGDYVSLIDYRKILEFHDSTGAGLTIAGTRVHPSETHKYGMMKTDSSGRLTNYVEKPVEAVDTDFASMGIYMIDTRLLAELLQLAHSRDELGLNLTMTIVPEMLDRGAAYAYNFEGYWRDVGTIQSYFEANQELIKIMPELNLYDYRNPIRSRVRFEAPAKICEYGSIKNSLVTQACIIDGHVERSIIFPHVKIEKGAVVLDSLIMPNNYIGANTVIKRTIVDTALRSHIIEGRPNIGADCVIGDFGEAPPNHQYPHMLNSGITVIGMQVEIPDGARIGRNCIVWPDVSPQDFGDRRELLDGESLYPSYTDHSLLKLEKQPNE